MFGFGSVGGGAAPGVLNNAQIKQRPPSSALNLNQFQKVRPTAVAGNASIGTQRPMMQQSTAQMMSSHFGSIGGGASRPAAIGSPISGGGRPIGGSFNASAVGGPRASTGTSLSGTAKIFH